MNKWKNQAMKNCSRCGEDFYGPDCKNCGPVATPASKPYQAPRKPKQLYGDVVAQECKKLMNDRLDGKIGSFELSEKMYELDKKYPNIGFDVQAAKVFKAWEQNIGKVEV